MTDVPGPAPFADEVVARSLDAAVETRADTGPETDTMSDSEDPA